MSPNEDGASPEPSTSYTFGPNLEGQLQRLREKMSGPDDPPRETAEVFSAALSVLETIEDKSAEGKALIINRRQPGTYGVYAADRGDLQAAVELLSETKEES